jgi:hypothetical protein
MFSTLAHGYASSNISASRRNLQMDFAMAETTMQQHGARAASRSSSAASGGFFRHDFFCPGRASRATDSCVPIEKEVQVMTGFDVRRGARMFI